MPARRVINHLLGLAGPLLIAATVAVIPAAQAEAMTARATPAAVLTGTGVLDDVVSITATNAWAVGHYGGLANPKTLVEHWNGTGWHRVSVKPAAGWLNGVAATSARDVWAVGFSGSRALILHFNGNSWRRVASPAAGSAFALLADVTAISPHNAWVAGNAGSKSLIEHWNGTAWKRVPSPSPQSPSFLSGISAASASDVWAVGGFSDTLILHWNGTAWRRISIPVPANGGMLIGVYAASGRNAWAVGCTRTFGNIKARPLVLHWNGTAWK